METEARCTACGKLFDQELTGGLCQACALKIALENHEAQSGSDTDPLDAPVSSKEPAGPFNLSDNEKTRIGHYKLLQKIGEGGFGAVYMAEQEEPVRRPVALKIIKPGMDTKEVIARFEAERQALAMMDHPNIAKIYDGGVTPSGRPYFVMEWVNGMPITEYSDHYRLHIRQRLNLFLQVCQAVQHAHQKGIIHRDIKPSNILVALQDASPVPKVIDFGVAKATQARLTEHTMFTKHGQIVGTPAYMSPEQIDSTRIDLDTRTDIYSLGVLLYELLVGHTPFEKAELFHAAYEEIRRRIRDEQPPRPSLRVTLLDAKDLLAIATRRCVEPRLMRRQIVGDLDWITMKAMEKDRNRRYETSSSLALDVEHYLHNEPVVAGPPELGYRLGKFLKRHKKVVAMGTAVALLLAVISVLSINLRILRIRETDRERLQFEKDAGELAGDIKAQLVLCAEASQSINRFYEASETVSPKEFKLFTKQFFEWYPFIVSAQWAPKLPYQQKEDFEKQYGIDITGPNSKVLNETNDLFPLFYWEGIAAQTRPAFGLDLGCLYPDLIKQCAESKKTVLTMVREPGANTQYIFLSPFYARTDRLLLNPGFGPILIPRNPWDRDASYQEDLRGISVISIDIDRLMEPQLKRLRSPEIDVFLNDENDHTLIFRAYGGLEDRSGEIEVRGISASIEFLNARWVLRLVDSSN